MANISKDLESNLKKLGFTVTFFDKFTNNTDNPNEIYEGNFVKLDKGYISMKSLRIPKNKLVDITWVMNKLNNDKIYVNFAKKFKLVLTKLGIKDNVTVYPTSYGIGIFRLFNRNQTDNIKSQIETILNKTNIEFNTEYSDAAWVFRYKISRKKENIEKLNNFLLENSWY